MKTIFEYLEYRDLLRDYFEARKSVDTYSYRLMAEVFGMDTGNLFRILHRQAHLPARCLPVAIEILGLSGRSAECFQLLVAYSRERKDASRNAILEKVFALRELSRRELLDVEVADYGAWWGATMRLLLQAVNGCSPTPKSAEEATEDVGEDGVAEAFLPLEALGFSKRVDSGRLRLVDPHEDTGQGGEEVARVHRYQRKILDLASSSLDRVPKEERDISTLTMAVDAKAEADILELIGDVRRRIQRCVERVVRPESVMQLAISYFPLSTEEQAD